jgi:DNA-binding transcriptional LysR family regulator
MASVRSEIGSLAPLFAFEAAGRLGSFTRGAAELGVTQAAISKQISSLEEWIGKPLFVRRPRHVELTAEGQELFATTSLALSSIARTMRNLKLVADPPIGIALSVPLSQFWLMPIISEFTKEHPAINLRILAQDDLAEASGADLIVRFQHEEIRKPAGLRLFDGEVVAMASSAFLRDNPLSSPADVLAAPLIHYDTPDRSWISWSMWAEQAGLPPRPLQPALSLNRYQDAVIAAMQGQGVALVWKLNGRPLVFAGTLEAVPGPCIRAPGAFYLETPGTGGPATDLVIDWLMRVARRPV